MLHSTVELDYMFSIATVSVLHSKCCLLPRLNNHVHIIIFVHGSKCFVDLANLTSNFSRHYFFSRQVLRPWVMVEPDLATNYVQRTCLVNDKSIFNASSSKVISRGSWHRVISPVFHTFLLFTNSEKAPVICRRPLWTVTVIGSNRYFAQGQTPDEKYHVVVTIVSLSALAMLASTSYCVVFSVWSETVQ